jgi:hypothetical protein
VLVNEVYLWLVDLPQLSWQDRAGANAIHASLRRQVQVFVGGLVGLF